MSSHKYREGRWSWIPYLSRLHPLIVPSYRILISSPSFTAQDGEGIASRVIQDAVVSQLPIKSIVVRDECYGTSCTKHDIA